MTKPMQLLRYATTDGNVLVVRKGELIPRVAIEAFGPLTLLEAADCGTLGNGDWQRILRELQEADYALE